MALAASIAARWWWPMNKLIACQSEQPKCVLLVISEEIENAGPKATTNRRTSLLAAPVAPDQTRKRFIQKPLHCRRAAWSTR